MMWQHMTLSSSGTPAEIWWFGDVHLRKPNTKTKMKKTKKQPKRFQTPLIVAETPKIRCVQLGLDEFIFETAESKDAFGNVGWRKVPNNEYTSIYQDDVVDLLKQKSSMCREYVPQHTQDYSVYAVMLCVMCFLLGMLLSPIGMLFS